MSIPATEKPIRPASKSKAKVWRTKSQWKALLDEFEASDLTKAAFCQQHGIASSSLYKWQNYFTDQTMQADFIDITTPLVETKSLQNTRDPKGCWQVELELGGGVTLRVRVN